MPAPTPSSIRGPSLRFKVRLILLLVVLLPVLGLGIFAYELGRQQATASELNHLAEKSQELSNLVDKHLASNAQLVRHLAATAEVENFLKSPAHPEAMNAWLQNQSGLSANLEAILILDPKGNCLASSDARSRNQNYAFRSYFKDGMAGLSRLTDFHIGFMSHSPCVFIASPVRAGEQILGLTVLRIAMEPVQRMMAQFRGHGHDAFLVSRDGVLLAHSRTEFLYRTLMPLTEAKRRELMDTRQFMDLPLYALEVEPRLMEAVTKTIDLGQATQVRYHLEGQNRWAALTRLDEEPWAVGIAVNEATVLAPARRLLGWTLGAALLSTCLALVVGLVFSRRILKPLENLAGAMEQFGQGESSHRASCQSQDEVGRLAANFNQMADQISAQTQALENRLDSLEEILPICSACKKIRNEVGTYESVDTYLSTRTRTQFSHGLCEDCAHKLYPEIFPGKPPLRG